MTYAAESRELDGEIRRVIEAWVRHGRALTDAEFDDLALRLFEYQRRYNEPYARFCASLGFGGSLNPASWREIPAVPAAAFKEATLTTFDPAKSALAFETSGTTTGLGGRHYMETRDLYDAALGAAFDRFMLADGAALRYLNLVPNPSERPQSSLGYMMQHVSATRGDGQTGWYLRGDELLFEAFVADIGGAIEDAQGVCIATTAFALAHALDTCEARGITFALPPGSRVMETGGFKGRALVVDRETLYARASRTLGIPPARILAEYGMTELTSQYYDAAGDAAPRKKLGPPWLRTRVVAIDGTGVPNGTVGALVHVDLANRGSCIAIATEDLGALFDDGLVLLGREHGSRLRGCSLDAEDLRSV
ncbi:MAG: hypothetical protein JO199_14620 [Candidatus Eremiobacteraeota bacterium]|nr:hypothetical protein [Candidatus Eremiobacteraeota bacterium]